MVDNIKIKGIIVPGGLVGHLTITQIKSTDKAIPEIANAPHSELLDKSLLFNEHHLNYLSHYGNFTVNGDFLAPSGAIFNVDEFKTTAKNMKLNDGHTAAEAQGGGIEIVSGANITHDNTVTSKWRIDGKEIKTFNANGTLSVGPSGSIDSSLISYAELFVITPASTSQISVSGVSHESSFTSPTVIELENRSYPFLTQNYWSAASGTISTNRRWADACGSQNSGLTAGGMASANAQTDVSELFNGSVWTLTTSLLLATRLAHVIEGTSFSAIAFGGWDKMASGGVVYASTEKFNGSSWSSASANLNTARANHGGAGSRYACLTFGGTMVAATATQNTTVSTERYNGTSWVATSNLLLSSRQMKGAGIQNSALCMCGISGTDTAISLVEIWNGSYWSTGASTNATHYSPGATGTSRNAIINENFVTETYNGVAWTTSSASPTSATWHSMMGSGNLSLYVGGVVSIETNATYKWYGTLPIELKLYSDASKTQYINCGTTLAGVSGGNIVVDVGYLPNVGLSQHDRTQITELLLEDYGDGKWTATGSMNVPKWSCAGCGTQNSTLAFGGSSGADLKTAEKFNGSSWTLTADMTEARQHVAGCGTQNSALAMGGFTWRKHVEKFNGSSWSATGELNIDRTQMTACGIQNSALSIGGGYATTTEKFNGSSWTATGNMNLGRTTAMSCGSQNKALVFGGWPDAFAPFSSTEKFNGSSWTATGNMNVGRGASGESGTQNSALVMGGTNIAGAQVTSTEKFNGYMWVSTGSLLEVRNYNAGSGTQNSALTFGGWTSNYAATTEKFNSQMTVPGTIALLTYK